MAGLFYIKSFHIYIYFGLCQTFLYTTRGNASTDSTTDTRSDYITGNSSVTTYYAFANGTASDEHTNVTADYVTTPKTLVELERYETTLLCHILKSKDFYSSILQDTISYRDTVIFTDTAGDMSEWIQMIGCFAKNITPLYNTSWEFNLTTSQHLEECKNNCQRLSKTGLTYFSLQDKKCRCISKEFNRSNPHDVPRLCTDGNGLCCGSEEYTVLVYDIGEFVSKCNQSIKCAPRNESTNTTICMDNLSFTCADDESLRSASRKFGIDLTNSFACDFLRGESITLAEKAKACVSLAMHSRNDYRISCKESLFILCNETEKLECPTISPVDTDELNKSNGFCSVNTCIFPIVCGCVGLVLVIAVTCCLCRVKFDKPKRIMVQEINNTSTEEEVQLNTLSTLPSTNSRYSLARPGNTVTEEEIQFNTRNTLPSTISRYSLANPGNTARLTASTAENETEAISTYSFDRYVNNVQNNRHVTEDTNYTIDNLSIDRSVNNKQHNSDKTENKRETKKESEYNTLDHTLRDPVAVDNDVNVYAKAKLSVLPVAKFIGNEYDL